MTTSGYPVFGANGFVGFFHEYNHEDETVAITCRGNTCGTINRIPPKTYITGNSMALDNIKSREVSQNYLYYALKYRGVGDSISGSAQPQITGAGLRAVEFPAPPLPEQQKIAAILSSVDDVIEKTRAQIDKLKDLKSGMMQELLTRGIGSGGVPHTDFKDSPVGRIPVSWRVAKLAQVTKVVDSLHQTPTFANDGFPMIRVSDIKPGKVNTERAFKVSQEVFNQFTKNHKPQKSDLLMSRVGSYGVCCYLNRDIDVCLGQNTVVIIPDRIDSLFLYHSIYSEAVQNQIEFEVAGSGYKSLSLASIRSLSIPLPPDDEQKQIADILVSIDDQIEVKNRKLKAVSNAKKALMQDLLTGKVRVNIDQKESAVA
jgi:type I restriction enzyme S subunit